MSIRLIKNYKKELLIGIIILLSIPIIPIILNFIYNLGVYFGIFIRNLYQIVCF